MVIILVLLMVHFLIWLDQILNLTPILEGMIGSAICLGCAVGAVIGGRVADIIGRKRTLMYLAILFFIATLGCALSMSAMMIICRLFWVLP